MATPERKAVTRDEAMALLAIRLGAGPAARIRIETGRVGGAGPEPELRIYAPDGRMVLDVRATLGRFANFRGVDVAKPEVKPEPGPRQATEVPPSGAPSARAVGDVAFL